MRSIAYSTFLEGRWLNGIMSGIFVAKNARNREAIMAR